MFTTDRMQLFGPLLLSLLLLIVMLCDDCPHPYAVWLFRLSFMLAKIATKNLLTRLPGALPNLQPPTSGVSNWGWPPKYFPISPNFAGSEGHQWLVLRLMTVTACIQLLHAMTHNPKCAEPHLWPHAIKHANHMLNLFPREGNDKSPDQLFSESAVDPNINNHHPLHARC